MMWGYGMMYVMLRAEIQAAQNESERLRALHGPAPIVVPVPVPTTPLRDGWWRCLFGEGKL
jgi:hypothetical protein